MPTTNAEIDKIIELCLRHGLKPSDMLLLTKDLKQQVGDVTENGWLRLTTNMLYERAWYLWDSPGGIGKFYWEAMQSRDKPQEKPVPSSGWYAAYWLVAIGHLFIWLSMFTSCALSLWYEHIWVSIPINIFAGYLLLTSRPCPVTELENVVRRKLGWTEIKHFTHWYIICPLFHGRTCDRKCTPIRIGPH